MRRENLPSIVRVRHSIPLPKQFRGGFFSKVNLAQGILTAETPLRPALAAAGSAWVEFAFQPNRIRGMRPALSASLWKI
jgi:hypothetical protein